MRYILWVVALLGTCNVIQDGSHVGFYPKLEIVKNYGNLNFFMIET